jgi:hypothetical protein
MDTAADPRPQGDPDEEPDVGEDLDKSASRQVCIELHAS